jgi:ABC-type branched-subunit amino acid transport system ATPase component
MLVMKNIKAGYAPGSNILKGVDLTVDKGEAVAIIGKNGAGKSTLVKSVMGMIPYISGEIIYKEKPITAFETAEISKKGISLFMQGGRVFPHLTVEENLNFAGINLDGSEIKKRKERICEYFSFIKGSRKSLKASYLSGGEKHQLALAMILMDPPELLILDEPSAGLSPDIRDRIYKILSDIKGDGMSCLLIEHNISMAYSFSDRVRVLKNGVLSDHDVEFETVEKDFF